MQNLKKNKKIRNIQYASTKMNMESKKNLNSVKVIKRGNKHNKNDKS